MFFTFQQSYRYFLSYMNHKFISKR